MVVVIDPEVKTVSVVKKETEAVGTSEGGMVEVLVEEAVPVLVVVELKSLAATVKVLLEEYTSVELVPAPTSEI